MIGISVRSMAETSSNGMLGDVTIFGDLKFVPVPTAFRYYNLNKYQRKSITYLVNNYLKVFCEYWGYDEKLFRSVVTISRSGFSEQTKQIFISATIMKPDKDELRMHTVESRAIHLGRKGGMKLINPLRRGTVPHGKSVLLAVPDITILGIRTNFDGAE